MCHWVFGIPVFNYLLLLLLPRVISLLNYQVDITDIDHRNLCSIWYDMIHIWRLALTNKTTRGNSNNNSNIQSVGHSKIKLWTFFWGDGEHQWPLVHIKLSDDYICIQEC